MFTYEIYNKETGVVTKANPETFGGQAENSFVEFALEDGSKVKFNNPMQEGQLQADGYLVRQIEGKTQADGSGTVEFPTDVKEEVAVETAVAEEAPVEVSE